MRYLLCADPMPTIYSYRIRLYIRALHVHAQNGVDFGTAHGTLGDAGRAHRVGAKAPVPTRDAGVRPWAVPANDAHAAFVRCALNRQ